MGLGHAPTVEGSGKRGTRAKLFELKSIKMLRGRCQKQGSVSILFLRKFVQKQKNIGTRQMKDGPPAQANKSHARCFLIWIICAMPVGPHTIRPAPTAATATMQRRPAAAAARAGQTNNTTHRLRTHDHRSASCKRIDWISRSIAPQSLGVRSISAPSQCTRGPGPGMGRRTPRTSHVPPNFLDSQRLGGSCWESEPRLRSNATDLNGRRAQPRAHADPPPPNEPDKQGPARSVSKMGKPKRQKRQPPNSHAFFALAILRNAPRCSTERSSPLNGFAPMLHLPTTRAHELRRKAPFITIPAHNGRIPPQNQLLGVVGHTVGMIDRIWVAWGTEHLLCPGLPAPWNARTPHAPFRAGVGGQRAVVLAALSRALSAPFR